MSNESNKYVPQSNQVSNITVTLNTRDWLAFKNKLVADLEAKKMALTIYSVGGDMDGVGTIKGRCTTPVAEEIEKYSEVAAVHEHVLEMLCGPKQAPSLLVKGTLMLPEGTQLDQGCALITMDDIGCADDSPTVAETTIAIDTTQPTKFELVGVVPTGRYQLLCIVKSNMDSCSYVKDYTLQPGDYVTDSSVIVELERGKPAEVVLEVSFYAGPAEPYKNS